MNLIQQVCSIDIAKKLKDLGVKQESYFVYYKLKENNDCNSPCESWQIDDDERFDIVSSFTISELCEMLPENVPFTWVESDMCKHTVSSITKYGNFTADTQVNAFAKMLIHLIENGLMEVKR